MTADAFCAGCGTSRPEGASFCQSCGAKFDAPIPPVGLAPTPQVVGAPRTNTLAIIALVSSFFIPVLGMVLAYSARKEIQASRGGQSGWGLTTGAIVLNWIWISSLAILFLSALAGQ